jgi:hypothetical protein
LPRAAATTLGFAFFGSLVFDGRFLAATAMSRWSAVRVEVAQ